MLPGAPTTGPPASTPLQGSQTWCSLLCSLHTAFYHEKLYVDFPFFIQQTVVECLQAAKRIFHDSQTRHHEGVSSPRTSTEHLLCPPSTTGPSCPPPPPLSLIDKQEAQLVVDRERKAYVFTSLSLLSKLSQPRGQALGWSNIKTAGGGIAHSPPRECGASLGFTGRKTTDRGALPESA